MTNGELKVRLEVDSYFLEENLPIEVRDARLNLVRKLSVRDRPHPLEVPAGLYRVSAMLDDGRMHERVVQVAPDEETEVVFRQVGTTSPPPSPPPPRKSGFGFSGPAGGTTPSTVPLVGVDGASVHARDGDRFVFAPDGDLRHVPVARFALPVGRVEVSLPVNPLGAPPVSLCSVAVTATGVSVDLAPERRVASTVLGLIRSKEVLRGMEIVQRTTTLLRDKYRDPVGAALGGLLLQRLGHLEERADWVDNLARDFTWLPDGRILKAALDRYADDEESTGGALDLALAAARVRPLFTDAFSLLLQLLRRWPGGARAEERRRALAELATTTAAVDWESVTLTLVKKEGG
ncbi:MAG: hypothetical protein ACF8XB_11385 [Planctomycetota bacterium JB042]